MKEEGMPGVGPTPFKTSMSSAKNGHSIKAHMASAGRGGEGRIGRGDSVKTAGEDVSHPDSHGAFESLGVSGGGD